MTGPMGVPSLVMRIALRRVARGAVAWVPGAWVDGERPVPTFLPGVLDALYAAGLVDLSAMTVYQRYPARLTDAGRNHYAVLSGRRSLPTGLNVPAPQHPSTGGTGTPADCRVSVPAVTAATGNRPDPAPGGVLRWARDPCDDHAHAVARGDVLTAPVRGYVECLCGHRLPVGVVLADLPAGRVCVPCVIGAVSDLRTLGPLGDRLSPR